MPAVNSIIADAGSLASAVIAQTFQKETVRMTGDSVLKPRDIQAICRYLKLPTPTPDVTFDNVLEMSGLSREDVYVRLERSTDIDVMIASAALRSGVTRCADDKRLKPEPHRRATKVSGTEGVSTSSPRKASVRSTDDLPATAEIATVGECPSKPGSERAKRFALYRVGATVAELLEGGLRAKDIRRHLADGVITLK